MHDLADAQRLRVQDDDRRVAWSQADGPPAQGSASRVATITGTGYANAFNAVTFQSVTGTETAGQPGTLTAADSGFAYNLGGSTPSAGTEVVCTYVDWRWVFRYG